MRQSKTITIDDDRITVFEVIVEDLLAVIESSNEELRERVDELLPKCSDLPLSRMKKMAPSELNQVWEAFREVNSVFFSTIDKLGIMGTIIPEIKKAVVAEMQAELQKGPAND